MVQKPMIILKNVSIIIPVGPGDSSWSRLLGDLRSLNVAAEICIVGVTKPPKKFIRLRDSSKLKLNWITSERGRALQLNHGVGHTTGRYLWFIHADTRLDLGAIVGLDQALATNPKALHYFDLAFEPQASSLMKINCLGAWFRSHLLGLPFGDQGLCLSRRNFNKLGGYRVDRIPGEDHLLVWAAHQNGVQVKCVGKSLITSSRKYQKLGWATVTTDTVLDTIKQATPEAIKLLKSRIQTLR